MIHTVRTILGARNGTDGLHSWDNEHEGPLTFEQLDQEMDGSLTAQVLIEAGLWWKTVRLRGSTALISGRGTPSMRPIQQCLSTSPITCRHPQPPNLSGIGAKSRSLNAGTSRNQLANPRAPLASSTCRKIRANTIISSLSILR